MRKRIVTGVVVLVVVAAGAFLGMRVLRPEPAPAVSYTETTVEPGSITQTVFGHGTVEPVEERAVRTARAGTITSISVTEGQAISPGDELFRVDDRPVYALGGDDPFYRVLSSSEEEGADVASLQRLLTGLGLYEGEEDGIYGSATRAAVEDFLEERGEERGSRVGPETFQAVGDEATVARVDLAVGDAVTAGQAALVVTVGGGLQTVLHVNEIDIAMIEVGQRVELTVDALAGESYVGRVTEVSTGLVAAPEGPGTMAAQTTGSAAAATAAGGIVEFPVTVTFDDPEAELLTGMSVDGDIVVAQVDEVLVVPITSVLEQDGKDVVLVPVPPDPAGGQGGAGIDAAGDQVELRPVEVELGLSSDSLVEIRSGLTQGQVIVADILVAESGDPEEGGLLPGGIPGGRMTGVRQGIEGLGGQ